jgi:O-antigen/teichoic acid export membrane protein
LADGLNLSAEQQDIAALAKGGRTNVFGFMLRLVARIPFLFIAGRLYGAEDLGRFASAMIAVELAAQLATFGQKRGLAQQLAGEDDRPPACVVADALLLSGFVAALLAGLLYMFPAPMFPSGHYTSLQRLLPLAVVPLALSDVALAALAYRFDVAATVRARAVIEPWTLSLAAGGLWLLGAYVAGLRESGLIFAYVASLFAAGVASFVPLIRSYGLPQSWSPRLGSMLRLAWLNLPLAGADAIEWGSRKLDLFILGTFAPPAVVGIYYFAQQVASLPQALKTSFEPILGPVIARNLHEQNYPAVARQVCQVGFWIIAAQAGIALALGIPGAGVMGLLGPGFAAGAGSLALLLAAEVVAAPAVVSEAALIYIARLRNFWISLAMITLQAVLTIVLIELARRSGLDPLMQASGAAAAVVIAQAFCSFLKSRMLSRILGEPISNWRWALVWAAVPAVIIGFVFKLFPEWIEVGIGAFAILGVYAVVIWRSGFGPEDRVLFRKAPT